jgi:hypothetical protein
MSLNELQSWLFDEGIKKDLDLLTRHTILGELDNVDNVFDISISKISWNRLLLAASILARSEMRPHLEAALRIATGAIISSDSQIVQDAGGVLLNKLSNFRAFELADERGLILSELEERLGVSLRLEAQRRQIEQSILIESSGRWIAVNEFQKKFWDVVTNHNWLSVSAPTASGKSFVVIQWLIDQLRSENIQTAVYLAPTRALVSEIEDNLNHLIAKSDKVDITSLPLKEKFNSSRAEGRKIVFVFTQERLHLLANVLGESIHIDLMIVDEAQKIGDNHRGVILQDAIERIERTNPNMKIVFVSPSSLNPEVLLSDAPPSAKTAIVDADIPTVLQNIILAEQVPRKSKQWKLSLKSPKDNIPLGILNLASSPLNMRKRLAFISAAIGERGGTLVYANGAAEAEEVAFLIGQLVSLNSVADVELKELADLARKGVHQNYGLAPLVELGVAFHYGNMPSLIRLEVERLFRCGKIRFLVCTSTLIEGVNLSCRTIVVRGPRKGVGHPMEPQDFWNLAGRAGRWGNEFQGNIVCIEPEDKQAWPNGVPFRSRYPIKRESDAVIERLEDILDYINLRAKVKLSEIEGGNRFEPVVAYLLSTYLRLGTIDGTGIAKRHSPDVIFKLNNTLAILAELIEIGFETIEKHSGVNAIGLQMLLNSFRQYEGDVENLLPATVDSLDSYDRFVTIMHRINEHLFPAFLPDSLVPLYARIIVQWLKGYSLSFMIQSNIDYHKKYNKSYKLPLLIRQTMELVEQISRFKAPKFLSAYVDVLHIHLHQIGREDLIEDEIDIGTQLEFGVSSRTLLSLMEIGLSRMSAVALYEKIAHDDLTKEECITWVRNRVKEFDGLDIPAIILREIKEKFFKLTN